MKSLVLFFSAWVIVSTVAVWPFPLNSTAQQNKSNPQQSSNKPSPSPSALPARLLPSQESKPNKANGSQPYADEVGSQSQPKTIRIAEVPPPDTWYKTYILATIIVAVVTIGLGFIGFFGVRYARKTLKAVELQGTIMQGQLSVMREQTSATSKSAEGAKSSADSANRNIELFIEKERARVHVEMLTEEPQFLKIAGTNSQIRIWAKHGILYKVSFSGATAAYDVNGIISARVLEDRNAEPDPSAKYYQRMDIPRMISPQTDIPAQPRAFLWKTPFAALTETEISRIESGQLFVHVFGIIQYKDVFDKTRNSEFHYCWAVKWLSSAAGTPIGQWLDFMENKDG
jgi:hypothetical protein